jgi:hypothetical protein
MLDDGQHRLDRLGRQRGPSPPFELLEPEPIADCLAVPAQPAVVPVLRRHLPAADRLFPAQRRLAVAEVPGDGSIDPLTRAVRIRAPIAHVPQAPLIEVPTRLDPGPQLTGQKAADVLVDLDPRDPSPAIGLDRHGAEFALRDQGPHGVLTDAQEFGGLAVGQEERRKDPAVMGRVEIRAKHVAERRADVAVTSIVRVVAR